MSKHTRPISAPAITQHMNLFSSPHTTAAPNDRPARNASIIVSPPAPHLENTTTTVTTTSTPTRTSSHPGHDDGSEDDDNNNNNHHHHADRNYETIRKESSIWIRELESIRDKLHHSQSENAMMMDVLAMAGIIVDKED